MAEAAPSYAVKVLIQKVSRGTTAGENRAKQVVGGGVTILSSSGALNVEAPIQNILELNDAQVAGLLGYLGLLNEGIDTSAIETAIATLVASS